jgi:hypothetical protein
LTTNSAISLHHTLLSNSLLLNPNALTPPADADLAPPSKAELLGTLRERLTRFRNFKPKRSYDVEFKEDEGSLYEYLEGVLMRGIKPLRVGQRYVARELAIYDLRQLGEWEDEPDVQGDSSGIGGGTSGGAQVEEDDGEVVVGEEQIAQDIRRAKKFDFDICEFAVDPGQDLLVIVEIRWVDIYPFLPQWCGLPEYQTDQTAETPSGEATRCTFTSSRSRHLSRTRWPGKKSSNGQRPWSYPGSSFLSRSATKDSSSSSTTPLMVPLTCCAAGSGPRAVWAW